MRAHDACACLRALVIMLVCSRVGAGQVVKGLDEGLLGMKPGGLRRLYVPGPLSFPKGLKAAAGR